MKHLLSVLERKMRRVGVMAPEPQCSVQGNGVNQCGLNTHCREVTLVVEARRSRAIYATSTAP
jgi:hypothetical protein